MASFSHTAVTLYQAPGRIKNWLLKDDWSKTKLWQYEIGTHVPFIGEYMDYLLDVRSDEEYFNRYNMDYSDVHDPRKLSQVSSGSRLVGSGINFVSRNVAMLYNDIKPKDKKKKR